MYLLHTIGAFLIDVWLCSITWGSYLILFSLFITLLSCIIILRMRIITSVFVILVSFFITKVVFYIIGICWAHLYYTTYLTHPHAVHNPIIVIGSLALLYALLEIVLFAIIAKKYRLRLLFLSIITLLSNLISAMIVYNLPVR